MSTIMIGDRQSGKTTMLIRQSAITGATIAVATYEMVRNVEFLANWLGLEIPQSVTYYDIFNAYRKNKTKRYLVDELQMMFDQFGIDAASFNDPSLTRVVFINNTVKELAQLFEKTDKSLEEGEKL